MVGGAGASDHPGISVVLEKTEMQGRETMIEFILK